MGELTAINAGSNQLTIKTDKGESITLTLAERTRYLRVTPGETDLKNASEITLSDLGSGRSGVGLRQTRPRTARRSPPLPSS